MNAFTFKKATRHKIRCRVAIDGPAGSGKTFTAMRLATMLGKDGKPARIAFVSSEPGAAELYLGHAPDGMPFEFDILDLPNYNPETYTAAILAAGQAGYDVVVIDSLSHAWQGEGGALDLVNKEAEKSSSKNSYFAWSKVTPLQNRLIQTILRSPCHVIATMRSKMDYVLQSDERGKVSPQKVGLAPIQREGVEYEFDLYLSMDIHHVATVSKTRCEQMDGFRHPKPGHGEFRAFVDWLNEGGEPPPGYYTANEDDFKRMEAEQIRVERQQQREAEKAAPRKTAMELAQERAQRAIQKVQAANGVHDGTTPNTTPLAGIAEEGGAGSGGIVPLSAKVESGGNGGGGDSGTESTATATTTLVDTAPITPQPSTKEQRQKIKELFAELKVEKAAVDEMLAKFGVKVAHHLTHLNAELLIGQLNQAAAARVKAAATKSAEVMGTEETPQELADKIVSTLQARTDGADCIKKVKTALRAHRMERVKELDRRFAEKLLVAAQSNNGEIDKWCSMELSPFVPF